MYFKTIFIHTCLIFWNYESVGQNYQPNSKLLKAVYTSVIKFVDSTSYAEKTFIYQKQTWLHDIKDFDFKHPENYSLNAKTIKLDVDFKPFLSLIDTAKIIDNYTVPIISEVQLKHLVYVKKKPDFVLAFSPVVLSNDGRLAICTYRYMSGDSAAGVICYLRKINGRWSLVQATRLYLT